MMMRNLLALWLCASSCAALALQQPQLTRKQLFQSVVTTSIAGIFLSSQSALAEEGKLELTDEQVKNIVKEDILTRQFLVTGNLTPSIYNPAATFTDEIDTYAMDKWMTGTQKLFVGEKSDVRLIGDVEVSKEKIEFRFDEDLMFRIPFRPVVSLTGRVVLKRDETGE
jgi:hypothetical protein